jgi:hypothetical protein
MNRTKKNEKGVEVTKQMLKGENGYSIVVKGHDVQFNSNRNLFSIV